MNQSVRTSLRRNSQSQRAQLWLYLTLLCLSASSLLRLRPLLLTDLAANHVNCCAWCEFESFRKHGIQLCPDVRGLLLKTTGSSAPLSGGRQTKKRCIRVYLGRKKTAGGMLGGEGSTKAAAQSSQSIGQRQGEWQERCRLSNWSFAALSPGNLTE